MDNDWTVGLVALFLLAFILNNLIWAITFYHLLVSATR